MADFQNTIKLKVFFNAAHPYARTLPNQQCPFIIAAFYLPEPAELAFYCALHIHPFFCTSTKYVHEKNTHFHVENALYLSNVMESFWPQIYTTRFMPAAAAARKFCATSTRTYVVSHMLICHVHTTNMPVGFIRRTTSLFIGTKSTIAGTIAPASKYDVIFNEHRNVCLKQILLL